MGVITISRGCHSMGEVVAEKIADRLGYDCIGREVLLEASEQFNIPEIVLLKAIHDAPSIFERLGHKKEAYISYIKCALVRSIIGDDVVYHGLAGHLLLRELPHVLKVRITADMDHRVAIEMERDNLTAEEARRNLVKDDAARRKWAHYLYGIDTGDARLYDLIVHVGHVGVDDAVEIICDTATREPFRSTPESKLAVTEMMVACNIRSQLVNKFPSVRVSARAGKVTVNVAASRIHAVHLRRDIEELAQKHDGVREVEVIFSPTI